MPASNILIEGLTPDELIAFDDLETLVATGQPIIFKVGSAEVLAEFSIEDKMLNAKFSVVDSGGEGVLPTLISVIEKSGVKHGMIAIEWWIYARNCAVPNPKLVRILERLGFQIRQLPNGSECYWLRTSTNETLRRQRE